MASRDRRSTLIVSEVIVPTWPSLCANKNWILFIFHHRCTETHEQATAEGRFGTINYLQSNNVRLAANRGTAQITQPPGGKLWQYEIHSAAWWQTSTLRKTLDRPAENGNTTTNIGHLTVNGDTTIDIGHLAVNGYTTTNIGHLTGKRRHYDIGHLAVNDDTTRLFLDSPTESDVTTVTAAERVYDHFFSATWQKITAGFGNTTPAIVSVGDYGFGPHYWKQKSATQIFMPFK